MARRKISKGGLLGILVITGFLTLPAATAEEKHTCLGRPATIVGTPGNDLLKGGKGPDVIVALGGADRVHGKGGDDVICLGRGGSPSRPEAGLGDNGDDIIFGGKGEDLLSGGRGADRLHGGAGSDGVAGLGGPDRLSGGSGDDHLDGQRGADELRGGGGDDQLTGSAGNDLLVGGSGVDMADYFKSGRGVNVNLARGRARGQGRDRLVSIEGVIGSRLQDDRLIGNSKDNVFRGFFGDDLLVGRSGNDCLNPGGDVNEVRGGPGTDYYSASPGLYAECELDPEDGGSLLPGVTVDLAEGTATTDDETTTLRSIEGAYGSFFADKLMGDAGKNYLYGGPSDDIIEGRSGDDVLDGAGDNDTLNGGPGIDECLNGEVVMFCE